MTLHPADRLAFDRAVACQPVWNRFDTAAEASGLPENVLLHAGPEFSSVDTIPIPILNSAVVAAVWEGLAPDFDKAEAMIQAGEVLLKSAQDHDVVTPLAAVVSASMPLHSVYDAWRGKLRTLAPINGGSRPALRLGLRSEAVLEHVRWLNSTFLDVLAAGLGEGMALVPLAAKGLAGGDDCHGRTPVAGAILAAELVDRTAGGITDDDALEFLHMSPSLFLNLWMAATKLMMKSAEGLEQSSLVTAAGGNGLKTGVQISGLPGRWFTIRATPPIGSLDVDLPADRALGAIGDSAVVDAFGLGAMKDDKLMSADSPTVRSDALSIGNHPYFRETGVRLGIAARAVVESDTGPMVSLGIIDNEGKAGRLGGGLYQMPVSPFREAINAMEGSEGAEA